MRIMIFVLCCTLIGATVSEAAIIASEPTPSSGVAQGGVKTRGSHNSNAPRFGVVANASATVSPTITGIMDTEAVTVTYDALSWTIPGFSNSKPHSFLEVIRPVCDVNGCTLGSTMTKNYTISVSFDSFNVTMETTTVDVTSFGILSAFTDRIPNTAFSAQFSGQWSIEGPTETASGVFSTKGNVESSLRSIDLVRTPVDTGPVTSWSPSSGLMSVTISQELLASDIVVDGHTFNVRSYVPEPSTGLLLMLGMALLLRRKIIS